MFLMNSTPNQKVFKVFCLFFEVYSFCVSTPKRVHRGKTLEKVRKNHRKAKKNRGEKVSWVRKKVPGGKKKVSKKFREVRKKFREIRKKVPGGNVFVT